MHYRCIGRSTERGSNHSDESDAERVLEYHDAVTWNVYISVIDEIQNTREDVLKDYYHYESMFCYKTSENISGTMLKIERLIHTFSHSELLPRQSIS